VVVVVWLEFRILDAVGSRNGEFGEYCREERGVEGESCWRLGKDEGVGEEEEDDGVWVKSFHATNTHAIATNPGMRAAT
jgi:hypothetical protein